MVKHNVDLVLETKMNFHTQQKAAPKAKLLEISQYCTRKPSF